MFYCSFMVAEGKAAITLAADGEVRIRATRLGVETIVARDAALRGQPVPEPEEDADELAAKPKHQSVFNFSMQDWHAAKHKYNITTPLLN